MGIESIISIIPTIGNIVGSLLSTIFTEDGNSPLKKYSIRVGSSPTDEIDFIVENKTIKVANRTVGEVCLSFPAQNGNDGDVMIIPSCNKADVGELFSAYAENDINEFTLTVENPSSKKSILSADKNLISISSSGMVPIGGDTKWIGTYISAKIADSNITLSMPSSYSIKKVILLSVQPMEGNEVSQVCNLSLDNPTNTVTIPLSQTLIDGKEVHVGVTLGCTSNNQVQMMKENNKKYNVQALTGEEMERLANAVCVNRKS